MVNDYNVEQQIESVLDYNKNHNGRKDSSSSLGRAAGDKAPDDLIKYGSV